MALDLGYLNEKYELELPENDTIGLIIHKHEAIQAQELWILSILRIWAVGMSDTIKWLKS